MGTAMSTTRVNYTSDDNADTMAAALGTTVHAHASFSAVVTDDNGFRIRDNSDNTKQVAFECSGISGSTTRTLTVPDDSGTIASESFATALAVALG